MSLVGNPYLDEYLAVFGEACHDDDNGAASLIAAMDKEMDFALHGTGRSGLRHRYAFAIPTEEAIQAIAALSPIVEIGAGSGYWASLIAKAGAEVVAYDNGSWSKDFTEKWFDVQVGGVEKIKEHPGWTLLLCWPPYDKPMAYDCLKQHTGRHLAYVGEGCEGCTGDGNFHTLLYDAYEETRTVDLPQWPGIHDNLHLYDRKEKP